MNERCSQGRVPPQFEEVDEGPFFIFLGNVARHFSHYLLQVLGSVQSEKLTQSTPSTLPLRNYTGYLFHLLIGTDEIQLTRSRVHSIRIVIEIHASVTYIHPL